MLTWPFALSAAMIVALTAVALVTWRRMPAFTAVWVAYVVMLLPVSGLLHNGPQLAADRYAYLPTLGWALLAGAAVSHAMAARGDGALVRHRRALVVAAGVVLLTLAALTARQVLVWHDSVTMWRHALAVHPAAFQARANLADALDARGQHAEGLPHWEAAVRLRPHSAGARDGLGAGYLRQGRIDEAIAEFRESVRLKPAEPEPHRNLGRTLLARGEAAEAVAHLQISASLRADPETTRLLTLAMGRLGSLTTGRRP